MKVYVSESGVAISYTERRTDAVRFNVSLNWSRTSVSPPRPRMCWWCQKNVNVVNDETRCESARADQRVEEGYRVDSSTVAKNGFLLSGLASSKLTTLKASE